MNLEMYLNFLVNTSLTYISYLIKTLQIKILTIRKSNIKIIQQEFLAIIILIIVLKFNIVQTLFWDFMN